MATFAVSSNLLFDGFFPFLQDGGLYCSGW